MIQSPDVHLHSIIKIEDVLWTVLKKEISGTGQTGKTIILKLRNLEDSSVAEKKFRAEEKIEDVDSETRKLSFLYKKDDEFVFMGQNNYEQYFIAEKSIGEKKIFLVENQEIEGLFVEEQLKSVKFPETITLKVITAPQGIKGSDKEIELELGIKIITPHFIEIDDEIIIDTEDFSYIERVTKKGFLQGGIPGSGKKDKDDDDSK